MQLSPSETQITHSLQEVSTEANKAAASNWSLDEDSDALVVLQERSTAGGKGRLPVLALDARLAEVNILGVVEVETCHHATTGELLQTSCVEVSELLVQQGVRVLMCDAGMLAGLTVEIVEISHSSCLGNHAPIRSSDLAATVIELSDLSSLSSLRDTQEVMQQCWHTEHISEVSHLSRTLRQLHCQSNHTSPDSL